MTKRMKTRLWISAGAAAVAVLAWFAPPANDDVAAPAKASAGSAKAPAAQREASRFAALPQREPIGAQRGEIFGARTWTPPVVAAPAPRPPEPVAPPNPYKVAGTLVQAGTKRVYLVKGDRVYEAKQGDDLDEGYRVDSIAVDHVVLLYVPLAKKEELAISSTLGADVALASTASAAVPPAVPPTVPVPVRMPGLAPASSAAPAAPAASASTGSSDPLRPAELRWDGPEKVRAGASFSVALRVSSDQPLRATPMQLRYEPALLEAIGVRAGKFFGEGNFSYRVNPDGSIFVGATGRGMAPGADAELIVVTFKPIKPGATAEVKLSSVALQGAAGRALAHNQVGAFRTDIQ